MWNSDNVEKVLRDERLEKERQEREAKDQRRRDQEEIRRELLQSGGGADVEGEHRLQQQESDEANSGPGLEPFRLFDEPNAASGTAQNAEYVKEKEQKELSQKRRDGIAPLPLGGYTDASTTWYTQKRRAVGGEGEGVQEGEKRRRDDVAKQRDDPMTAIMKYSKKPAPAATALQEELCKKERPNKKKDKRGEFSTGISESEMEVLRKKRLEREAKERKKSAVLRAAIEVNATR